MQDWGCGIVARMVKKVTLGLAGETLFEDEVPAQGAEVELRTPDPNPVIREINRRRIEYELQRDEQEGLSFPAASPRPGAGGLSSDAMEFLLDTLFVWAKAHPTPDIECVQRGGVFAPHRCHLLDDLTVEVPKGTFSG